MPIRKLLVRSKTVDNLGTVFRVHLNSESTIVACIGHVLGFPSTFHFYVLKSQREWSEEMERMKTSLFTPQHILSVLKKLGQFARIRPLCSRFITLVK